MKIFVQIGVYDGMDEFREFVKFETPDLLILVEPNSEMNDKIRQAYSKIIFPADLVIENVAITEEDKGEVNLYHPKRRGKRTYEGKYNKCFSLLPMDDWGSEEQMLVVKVPSMSFMSLCRKYNLSKIDLLQIDTEGYDVEIIKSINFDEVDISAIIYEKWLFDQKCFTRYGDKAGLYGLNAMLDAKLLLNKLGYLVISKDAANYIAFKNG